MMCSSALAFYTVYTLSLPFVPGVVVYTQRYISYNINSYCLLGDYLYLQGDNVSASYA